MAGRDKNLPRLVNVVARLNKHPLLNHFAEPAVVPNDVADFEAIGNPNAIYHSLIDRWNPDLNGFVTISGRPHDRAGGRFHNNRIGYRENGSRHNIHRDSVMIAENPEVAVMSLGGDGQHGDGRGANPISQRIH
jgi:hypothetical protein